MGRFTYYQIKPSNIGLFLSVIVNELYGYGVTVGIRIYDNRLTLCRFKLTLPSSEPADGESELNTQQPDNLRQFPLELAEKRSQLL